MLLIFFGPSCSGKSSVADIIANRSGAAVYTGKDYLRLAKNEQEAWKKFTSLLVKAANVRSLGPESVIHVITEAALLQKNDHLTGNILKVKFTAHPDRLKQRFAERIKRELPQPLAQMIDRQADSFRDVEADLLFDTSEGSAEETAGEIIAFLTSPPGPLSIAGEGE